MNLKNVNGVSRFASLRIVVSLLLVGVLGFTFTELLPRIDASAYDIQIILTANLSYLSTSSIALEVTEPTGESCSWWHDTTAIDGWMSNSTESQRYHLANAMSGYYYIRVKASDTLLGDTNTACQVTVLLYEGTSEETVINYGPFMFTEAWTEVGCIKMPEAIIVEWGETAEGRSTSGCFIATAAYGTEMASEVKILSKFRDEHLIKSRVGERLVEAYYKVSPPIAKIIAENCPAKAIVRFYLKPWVKLAQILTGGKET